MPTRKDFIPRATCDDPAVLTLINRWMPSHEGSLTSSRLCPALSVAVPSCKPMQPIPREYTQTRCVSVNGFVTYTTVNGLHVPSLHVSEPRTAARAACRNGDWNHLQLWTCSCKRPSRGGEGTSPKTWMMMTWTDIASGRSLDGTDQSTTAVLGACRYHRISLTQMACHALAHLRLLFKDILARLGQHRPQQHCWLGRLQTLVHSIAPCQTTLRKG